MALADEFRTLKVRTNAHSAGRRPGDRVRAEGIVLCRPSHVLEADRSRPSRDDRSETVEHRKAALAKLLPMQRGDFGASTSDEGHPGHHPLLDPPLHEFQPTEEDDNRRPQAAEMKISVDDLKTRSRP